MERQFELELRGGVSAGRALAFCPTEKDVENVKGDIQAPNL